MILFLCGVCTGLGIAAVAAYVTCTRCVIPGVVGYTMGTLLEQLYHWGVLDVEPADEAEFLRAVEDVKQYPWNTTRPSTQASGISSKC